jgi:rhodanese-related sulfurtransferase
MADIERISAQQAHAKAEAKQALLICAYEDEAKCRMLNLDGSISFASFKSRVNSLSKSQEIIFYWAWPAEASAVGQAAKYQEQGFTNVKVLKGGVEAWKAAGYAMNWWLKKAAWLDIAPNFHNGNQPSSSQWNAPCPKLPEGSDWTYEVKLDGYRAIGVRTSGETILYSRNHKNFNKRFPQIAEALSNDVGASTWFAGLSGQFWFW